MANYVTYEPTELEKKLAAEREAADEAARAAVRAERQKFFDAREAAIQAERQRVRDLKTVKHPARVAAEAIRAELTDEAWAALVQHMRSTEPAKLKAEVLFIAEGEAAAAQQAAVLEGARLRSEAQAKVKADAQAALEARVAEVAA